MQTLLRALVLVAIVISLPACATSKPKQSSCCSSGDASCHAPGAKKKAN